MSLYIEIYYCAQELDHDDDSEVSSDEEGEEGEDGGEVQSGLSDCLST